MKTIKKPFSLMLKFASLAVAVFAGSVSGSVFAQSIPDLGEAAQFSVLAGSTVPNTGSTVVTGELGVSPGTAITGFPPGIVQQGQIRSNDAVAAQAVADALIAYNNLAGQAVTTEQAAAMGSGMVLIPGATATNVFWQVGTSATQGTNSAFYGSILAGAGITMDTGATLVGRALAGTAVTLDNNTVTLAAASTDGTTGSDPDTDLPNIDKVVDSEGQVSTAVIKAGATSNGGASYSNSFSTSEQIVVNGELFPETADVGKAASVFVVIRYTTTTGVEHWLMQDGIGDFFAWDQNVETLVSRYSSDSIGSSITGQLFSGMVDAGTYEIFIGYAAQGGSLIYSETPLTIVVTQL